MDREAGETSKRIVHFAFFLVLLWLILVARLAWIQLVQYDSILSRLNKKLMVTSLPMAGRGRVLDRFGKIFAEDEFCYQLTVKVADLPLQMGIVEELEYCVNRKARKFKDIYKRGFRPTPRDDLLQKIKKLSPRLMNEPFILDLAKECQLEADKVSKMIITCLTGCLKRWYYLSDEQPIESFISKEIAFKIFENPNRFPGISCIRSSIRRYPEQELASHVIGYMGKISEKNYKVLRIQGFYETSRSSIKPMILNDVEKVSLPKVRNFNVGVSGTEMIFNNSLRGQLGMQRQVRHIGQRKEIVEEKIFENGRDEILSLDLELQKLASARMLGKRGVVLLVDLDSGDILVSISQPNFNPNHLTPPVLKGAFAKLYEQPGVFMNKAVTGLYPFGSIFKIVTAVAAMEEEVIDSSSKYFCARIHKRTKLSCLGYHSEINVTTALKKSCNIFFYNASLDLGIHKLHNWALKFHLGSSLGTGYPYEGAGINPSPSYKRRRLSEAWYPGDTCNTAIGQGFQLGTPLQAAVLVGLISRPEGMKRPRYWRRDKSENLKIVLKPETRFAVRKGLWQVVNEVKGTAHSSCSKKVIFAGKTGTADTVGYKVGHPKYKIPHGWFAGFAPFDQPKVAVVVLIENGGHGGDVSAPLAKTLLEDWADKYMKKNNSD